MSDKCEPVIMNAQGFPFAQAEWALVVDGVIKEIAHTNNHINSPFGGVTKIPAGYPVPLKGEIVISVRGAHAHVGYLVDGWGNVTPAEGRVGPLQEGQSAMHDAPLSVQINAPVGALIQDDKKADPTINSQEESSSE